MEEFAAPVQESRTPRRRTKQVFVPKEQMDEEPSETPVKHATPRKFLKGFMQPALGGEETTESPRKQERTPRSEKPKREKPPRTPRTPKTPKEPKNAVTPRSENKGKGSGETPRNRNRRTPNPRPPREPHNEKRNHTPKKRKSRFAPHISEQDAENAVAEGKMYKGALRITADGKFGFITAPGLNKDIIVKTYIERNRAFDGDVVAVELLPEDFYDKKKKARDERDEAIAKKLEMLNITDQTATPSKTSDTGIPVEKPSKEEEESDSEGEEEDDLFKALEQEEEDEELADDDIILAEIAKEKQPENSKEEYKGPVTKGKNFIAKVVSILEFNRPKDFIGKLSPQNGPKVSPNDKFAVFESNNPRDPRFLVNITSIPDFYRDWEKYKDKLVHVTYKNWNEGSFLPTAKFVEVVGAFGEIASETTALLISNKVDYSDFSPRILKSIPEGDYEIPANVLRKRRDLRKERIFSIDPPTAKDLDDALHIKKIGDNLWEVGVHIADVSYFVKPNTPVDKEASARATSVYLVQKVIPMLPHTLCENLCSLHPGVDRLAFSVIWTLDQYGNIQSEWFGRTVIRSCSKMNYILAQEMIEGKITDSWKLEHLETYKDIGPFEGYSVSDIAKDVLEMHKIAVHLRKVRFDGGALGLNNSKVKFTLNEFGNPVSVEPYIVGPAHHLVEEFMLLANMQVAKRIADPELGFPEMALLRNHPTPKQDKLEEFILVCSALGLQKGFEGETAKAKMAEIGVHAKNLSEYLDGLKHAVPSDLLFRALQNLATRSMQLAKYFCTGSVSKESWGHFALNVQEYTHFTSPIRRYADIVVHRLLEASLALEESRGKGKKEPYSVTHKLIPGDRLTSICDHCNDKKQNSRKAQDQSAKVFLCLMLKEKPREEETIVLKFSNQFINVYIPTLSTDSKIMIDDLPGLVQWKIDDSNTKMTLSFIDDKETLRIEEEVQKALKETPKKDKKDFEKELRKKLKKNSKEKKDLTLTLLDTVKVKMSVKPNVFPMELQLDPIFV